MRRTPWIALLALALATALAGESPTAGEDPFARYLFPPDRVMGHVSELGLADAQRNNIRNEVQKVQSKFLDAQFELQSEVEKMTRLLQEKPVDEAKVLSQVDRILSLEKEVKKTQISLLIRIKNILTPAQQAKMLEIQKEGNR
jgi:Spy/CpxP family protein refolding chaperone